MPTPDDDGRLELSHRAWQHVDEVVWTMGLEITAFLGNAGSPQQPAPERAQAGRAEARGWRDGERRLAVDGTERGLVDQRPRGERLGLARREARRGGQRAEAHQGEQGREAEERDARSLRGINLLQHLGVVMVL